MTVLVKEEELLLDAVSAVEVTGGWSGKCGRVWFSLSGCGLGVGGLLGVGAWGNLGHGWFGGLVGRPWARPQCGLMGPPWGRGLSMGLGGLRALPWSRHGFHGAACGSRRGSHWRVW